MPSGPRRRGGGGGDDSEDEQEASSTESSSSSGASQPSRRGDDRLDAPTGGAQGNQNGSDSDATGGNGGEGGDGGGDSSGPSRRGDDRLDAPTGSGGGQSDRDGTDGGGAGGVPDSTPSASPGPPSQDSANGPRFADGNPESDSSSDVGISGPGGQTITEYEVFGDREDPPRPQDDEYTDGLEEGTREQFYSGLEDEDEGSGDDGGGGGGGEDGLSGLESEHPNTLDSNVADAVSDYQQQIHERFPFLDESDYAIRRDGDRLTVEYDDAAVASGISDRILAENEGVDRGDFAVRKSDDGQFKVEWGEHTGEQEAVDQLQQQVHNRHPEITTRDYDIVEAEDGGYRVEFDPDFQADRFQRRNPNLDQGEDFQVVSENGDVGVELTEEGQREQYRQAVAESHPDLDPEDVVVEERNVDPERLRPEELKHYAENPYKVRYSDEYLREQAHQQLAEEVPGADPEDYEIHVSDGEVSVAFDEQFRRERVREQFAAESERFTADDIARVTTRGPESVEDLRAGQPVATTYGIELTTEKQRELLEEHAREQYPDAEISVVENEAGDLVAQINGESQERFGDVAIPVPGTDKRVEDYLDAGSKGWSQFADGVAEGVAIPVTVAEGAFNVELEQLGGKSVGDVIGETATDVAAGTPAEGGVKWITDKMAPRQGDDGDIQPTSGEGGLERGVEGVTKGALEIVNLPAVAAGAKEGIEFTGYAISETVQGRAGVDVSFEGGNPDLSEGQVPVGPNLQTGRAAMVDVDVLDEGLVGESGRAAGTAAGAAVEYAKENPAQTAGMAAGSLVFSAGLISGASKVSTRAGRAAAWTIQPGEEALTSAVNRLPGASRVAERFPNNRIDNEEIFIRAGKRAARRARPAVRAARRARYDLQKRLSPEVRRFMRDESGQADLTGVGRGRRAEGEGQTGRSVEVDDTVTYADYETELRDEELSQTQEMLREQAEAELEARHDQFADVGFEESWQSVENALTMDPDELTSVRPRGRSRRPYRGGQPSDDAGMAWEGWSARQVETEMDSEVAAELESQRMEIFVDDEMDDVGLTMMAELEERFEQRQEALAMAVAASEELDAGMESEFLSEGQNDLGLEAEAEMDQELAQELALEQELEQATERMTEFETEFEMEMEFEMETETEAEAEIPDDPDRFAEEGPFAGWQFDTDVWATDFMSGDELLDELTGDDGGMF